jgi:octopine/nopaline transport system permease protein
MSDLLAFYSDVFARLLSGLPLTLQLTFWSLLCGGLFAALLTWMRASSIKPLRWASRIYVFVFRGTPLLVQMFLIYYGLAQFPEVRGSLLWPFLRDAWFCAVLALSLNTAAYTSEILRGGLQAVPFGQVEAARACGMSGWTLYRRIVFPIALRQALPSYSTEVILQVRATALASVITLMEITGVAQKLNSESYRAIEIFSCAGLIYLAVNFLVSRAFVALEHALTPHLRDMPERGRAALNQPGDVL